MTAATSQLGLADVDGSQRVALAQFFTPCWLADRMVSLIEPALQDADRRGYTLRILEPSAGRGALIAPILARSERAVVYAVELDAGHVRALSGFGDRVNVEHCDYLARAIHPYLTALTFRYDIALSNPPFTAGSETQHLAKILDESHRAILQLPIRSLHGQTRCRAIWSRVQSGEWWIRGEYRLEERPYPNASDDIVVLDMRRVAGPCELGWWRP